MTVLGADLYTATGLFEYISAADCSPCKDHPSEFHSSEFHRNEARMNNGTPLISPPTPILETPL